MIRTRSLSHRVPEEIVTFYDSIGHVAAARRDHRFQALVFLVSALALATPARGSGIFAPSYAQSMTFQDPLHSTTMTLAFDGTSFSSSSGRPPPGIRYPRYGAVGNLPPTFSPGLDFRSVLTNGDAGRV